MSDKKQLKEEKEIWQDLKISLFLGKYGIIQHVKVKLILIYTIFRKNH